MTAWVRGAAEVDTWGAGPPMTPTDHCHAQGLYPTQNRLLYRKPVVPWLRRDACTASQLSQLAKQQHHVLPHIHHHQHLLYKQDLIPVHRPVIAS